jgi:hypothetical protein
MRIFGDKLSARLVAVNWNKGQKMQLGNVAGFGDVRMAAALSRVLVYAMSRGDWRGAQCSVVEAGAMAVEAHKDVTEDLCEAFLRDHLRDAEVRRVFEGEAPVVVIVEGRAAPAPRPKSPQMLKNRILPPPKKGVA